MFLNKKNIQINLNGIFFDIFFSTDEQANFHFDRLKKFFILDNNNEFFEHIKINYVDDESLYIKLEKLSNISRKLEPYYEEAIIDGKNYYRRKDCFFVSEFEKNEYSIVSKKYTYALNEVMLELMSRSLESCKNFLFHGTSISLDDNNYSFISNSGGGKTTLMSKLFQMKNVKKNFLSNDRIILSKNEVKYFPIEINITDKIIQNDIFLKEYIKKHNYRTIFKPYEIEIIYENLENISMSYNPIIIIPKISFDNPTKVNLKDLSKEEKSRILFNNCFSIKDREKHRDFWIKESAMSDFYRVVFAKEIIQNYIQNNQVQNLEFGCDVSGEQIHKILKKCR